MIIVDQALAAREAAGEPVRVGMIGAGFMARGIANQFLNYVNGMRLVAIANRTVANAHAVFAEAGAATVREAENVQQLDKAIEEGVPVVTGDAELLCQAGNIDILLETTGHIEFGARVTMAAIQCGKDLVTMNAELDGTVGPILKRHADRAGTILSGCDGDQPAVQMNLHRFVESLGLTPLVCGNIKGLQDRYRTPETQASFARQWGQTATMVTSFADGTKISFEQAIVANATGMTIACRGMLGYDFTGHVDDLRERFDVDQLRELGGIVDYVVGAQPSPGVFVFGAHNGDPIQAHYLNYGKLGEGPLYSFYVPYHLTVLEAPISIARAALFRDTAIAPAGPPRVDVVTVAKRNLKAGEVLDGLGGFMTYGVCETSVITRREELLPMGIAEGCRLKADVGKDAVLTLTDVELPEQNLSVQLRQEQDKTFE